MSHHLPVVVAINKIGPVRRAFGEVLDAVYELFIDLGADEHRSTFRSSTPTQRRHGNARRAQPGTDLRPLFELLIEHTPAPRFMPEHPLQLLSQPVGKRLRRSGWQSAACGTAASGWVRGSRSSAMQKKTPWVRSSPADRDADRIVTSLTTAHGIERVDIEEPARAISWPSPGSPMCHRRHDHPTGRSPADG